MAEEGGGPGAGEHAEAAGRPPGRPLALDAVLEAMADGLMVFDAEGRVVHLNPAAAEAIRRAGYSGPEEADQFLHQRRRGEDGRPLPEQECPVRRALAGQVVRGIHLRVSRPGRAPLYLLASAAPLPGAGGAPAGAVLTFTDETELHGLSEARDDLVRMVSHDLRTPLSAIYTQAHLIRRGQEPAEKAAARASAIERGCERMSGMIQDLVEVTLLEAGQLPITLAVVDVAALVRDILEGMRGGLDVDRVRPALGGACWATLDPARLERVVVNLVSNALKYSAGEVNLVLRQGGGALVLEVADRGVGIAPADQARIFERYFRAEGARRPEGLGLGLYITRLLVEAQGGRIEVESTLGQGSTFRVVFPGAATADPAPPPAAEAR